MCWLCRLGAASDLLVCIWQHLPLRLKLCELTHLVRCGHVRQSLLVPATFAFDEVRAQCSTLGAEDLAESIAAVRLPLHLSMIRALELTFKPSLKDVTFPQLSRINTIERFFPTLFPTLTTAGSDSAATMRQPNQRRPSSVALSSLTHLQTLVLLDLQCRHCEGDSAARDELRKRPSVPFPHLSQLTTLVMTGRANSHCLSLLLSIPVQCPQLSHVDLEGLCLQPHLPRRAASDYNDAVEEDEEEEKEEQDEEGGDSESTTTLLLPFTRWLAGINHSLHLHGAIHRSTVELQGQQVIAKSATRIDYVQLCRLNPDSAREWNMTLLLSPFRFIFDSPLEEPALATWSAVRVVDMTGLQADLLTDVELISSLPPLPSLIYAVLPLFSRYGGMDLPSDSEIGVIAWLRSCPALAMLDNFTLHLAWSEAPLHLTASGVSDGLVSLGLLDAPRQQDSVTLEEAVLFKLFDDNMNHSCSFSALQYLTLPLGVTEKGRLSFRLTVLQSLPALHSLLLRTAE